MFSSKKNASYLNKPKNIHPPKPKRILGGWQDEQQQRKQTFDYTQKIDNKPNIVPNLLGANEIQEISIKAEKSQASEKFYLNWDELDERSDIECEKKLIEDIVQPGGIRIKPNDNMLNQLLKQIKGMETHIIGSLLLSKIQVNYGFQLKAKALYTIEFLIKKNQNYLAYFKTQCQKLKQFPEPEDNVENYRKILKSVLNIIGVNTTDYQQQQKQIFIDPGYNDQPVKKQTAIGEFLQENLNKNKKTENKKKIIGPGQSKPKGLEPTTTNENFLSLDLLGGPTQGKGSTKNEFDLLDETPADKKQPNNFDQSLNLI